MPRIRFIRPEFWSDATLAKMPLLTRHFYIALWNFADDEGRGRAVTRELIGFAFPLDNDITEPDIERSLITLADSGRIILYEVNGMRYYQVVRWQEHQNINRPTKSRIVAPDGYKTTLPAPAEAEIQPLLPITEPSQNNNLPITEPSVSLQGQAVGNRQQAVGNESFQAVGSRQQATDSVSLPASPLPPGSALPACLSEQVPGDLPASALPAGPPGDLLTPDEWRDLQNGLGHWTAEEIRIGLAIIRERGKRPRDCTALLHTKILPEVRAGKRPKCASVPARASPEAAAAQKAEEEAEFARRREFASAELAAVLKVRDDVENRKNRAPPNAASP